MQKPEKIILTPKQASIHPQLQGRLSLSKIYKLIHFNKIPYFKENPEIKQSPVYLYLEDIVEYLTRNRVASESEIIEQSAITA